MGESDRGMPQIADHIGVGERLTYEGISDEKGTKTRGPSHTIPFHYHRRVPSPLNGGSGEEFPF